MVPHLVWAWVLPGWKFYSFTHSLFHSLTLSLFHFHIYINASSPCLSLSSAGLKVVCWRNQLEAELDFSSIGRISEISISWQTLIWRNMSIFRMLEYIRCSQKYGFLIDRKDVSDLSILWQTLDTIIDIMDLRQKYNHIFLTRPIDPPCKGGSNSVWYEMRFHIMANKIQIC